MNKTLKWTIVSILIGGLLIYFGFWALYYFSMKEANEKGRQMSCQENIQEEFQGKIRTIDRYEYSSFMNENFFGLNIKTNDTLKKSISYQFDIEENKDLLEFVKTGQAIRKERGKDIFLLTTSDGVTKNFKVPDCDE